MKILVVGFMDFRAESQRGINVLTTSLAEQGLDVTFFTFPTYLWECFSKQRRSLLKGKVVDLGGGVTVSNLTKIVPIPYSSSRLPSKIKKRFFRIFEFSHAKPILDLNINDYDIVVVESGKGVFLERFLKGPIIIYRQSDPVEYGLDPDLAEYERRLIGKADLTLIVNQIILEKYQQEAPDLARKMVLWENGFDVPENVVYNNPYKNTPNALYFGLFPINWEAISLLAKKMPNLSIHIFGPFTRPRGLPGNVVSHGFRPHRQILNYMKYADIFLLPYEDIPERHELADKTSKLLLAMYYKLPIIASPFSYSGRLAKYGIFVSDSLEGFISHVGNCLSKSKGKNYQTNLKDYSIASKKQELIKILKAEKLI